MLPILLAFAAGMLLAHVVRQLIVHQRQDQANRRQPVAPRADDAWSLLDDEDGIRRSRDLARRLASANGDSRREPEKIAHSAEPHRARQAAAVSPLRGWRVTFRVRR